MGIPRCPNEESQMRSPVFHHWSPVFHYRGYHDFTICAHSITTGAKQITTMVPTKPQLVPTKSPTTLNSNLKITHSNLVPSQPNLTYRKSIIAGLIQRMNGNTILNMPRVKQRRARLFLWEIASSLRAMKDTLYHSFQRRSNRSIQKISSSNFCNTQH